MRDWAAVGAQRVVQGRPAGIFQRGHGSKRVRPASQATLETLPAAGTGMKTATGCGPGGRGDKHEFGAMLLLTYAAPHIVLNCSAAQHWRCLQGKHTLESDGWRRISLIHDQAGRHCYRSPTLTSPHKPCRPCMCESPSCRDRPCSELQATRSFQVWMAPSLSSLHHAVP